MNIRDFLQQLNEEAMPKPEDEQEGFVAPAAQTLAPASGSGDTDTGVEGEAEQAAANVQQELQPTDGESQPEETEENEPDADDDSLKKKPSQQQFAAQTSLPEESIQEEHAKSVVAPVAETKEPTAGAVVAEESIDESSFTESFKATLLEGADYKASEFAIKTLMESQGLEEDFVKQAVQIFEESVQAVAKANASKMAEYAAYVMESVTAQKLSEMEATLDARLNESVAAWHESNQIGIEQGVRVTVAEAFMDKLAGVLKEHFVQVPDLKKDLYEENLQVVSVQGLELKESKDEIKALQDQLNEAKKELFVESQMVGMTMLQKERVKELSKGLLFESSEDFKTKFEILKESVTEKKSAVDSKAILEDSVLIEAPKEIAKTSQDSFVDAIANTMGRYAKQR